MKMNFKYKKGDGVKYLFNAFLCIYAVISLYPLIWMLFYSLKNNDEIFVSNPFGFPTNFRVENYVKAWSQYDVPRYFINSMIVALCTVLITITAALLFSYATSRMKWRGRDAARIYVVLGMFVPVQAVLIPIAVLIKDLGLTNTHWAVIIPYAGFNISFATLVFYGFFKSLPLELEEAACIDGASIYTTFGRIIIPMVQPAIATLIIFTFLASWNEFLLANVLIIKQSLKTLPLGILFFQGRFTTDWGAMGATMVIASLPTILVYILFSRQVEKAMTVSGAVKG